uniref:7TM_GPCR_Srx domain-containing protein n=1 Tax=Steinernema glaseri TaxID=37863 RepID=A0A1I7YRL2_9BILA
MVSPMQSIVGAIYIFVAVVFTPIYARIIYIFIYHKCYRSLECYRIMIQIGVIQIVMGPEALFIGLTHLLDQDFLMIANTVAKVMSSFIRMESILSLVLAMNRLKIICGLGYSTRIHTVIVVLAWIFGIVYAILLFTPCCNYKVVPGEFLPKYDLSRPHTATLAYVGSAVLSVTTLLNAMIYVVIVAYLVYQRRRHGTTSNFQKEKTIFLYATIRFVIDMTLTVVYNFIDTDHLTWLDFPVFLGYILNNLAVSPVLYLSLYRSLRKEFWCGSSQSVTVVVATPNSPAHTLRKLTTG